MIKQISELKQFESIEDFEKKYDEIIGGIIPEGIVIKIGKKFYKRWKNSWFISDFR